MRTCGISWSLAAILALAFFSEAMSAAMPRIPGYPNIMSQILANTYASPSVAATGSKTLGESCGEYEPPGSATSQDDGDCEPGLECHFDPAATGTALPEKAGKCLKPNGATCMQNDDCKSGKCAKSVSNYAYNSYHIPGAGSLLTMSVCIQAGPLYTLADLQSALLSQNTGSTPIVLPHNCNQYSEVHKNNPGDCKSQGQCIWVPKDLPLGKSLGLSADKCLHKTEFLYIKLQNALNRRGKNKFSLQISYASQPAPATMPYGPYGPTVIQSLYGNVKQGYPPRQYGGYGQSYGGYGQSYGGYGQSHGGYGQTHGGYGQSHGGYGQSYGGYDAPYSGYEKPYGGYEKPYDGYGKPYGGYEKPYDGYDVPRDGYEKPSGGYEKPYGGYEKPYGGYEKPYGGYDVPRDGYEKPYGGYDVPRDGYEKPYGGYEKPYGQETYPPSPNYDPKPQYGNGKYEETTYADTPYQPETYSEPPYQPETYSEPPYQPETYSEPPYQPETYDKPYGGYGQPQGGYGQPQYVGYGHQQSYSGYDRPYGRRPYNPPRPRGPYGKGSRAGHPQEKPPTTPTPETEPASAEVEPDFS